MNYIWAGMIAVSVITAAFTGRGEQVSNCMMDSTKDAVALFTALLGMMCLWSGLSEVAEKTGLTRAVNKLLHPLMKRLFPKLKGNSPAMQAMSMNVTANLLGPGNAATPLGLQAMKNLQEINPDKSRASDEMITFLILNTSCLQLIPTTVAMLRQQNGAVNPMDILLPVWLCSVLSLAVGILFSRLFGFNHNRLKSRGCGE